MTTLLLLLLYIQFVNEYVFLLPRNPYLTYIITILIFCCVLIIILQKKFKNIDKTIVVYFLCIPLVLVNDSFLASVNIFGFVLYLRSKANISIKKLGILLFIINFAVIVIVLLRIYENSDLIKVWGKKLNRDIVVHGFNNPNTEAEFYYFCALGLWLAINDKYIRSLFVLLIIIVAYSLTSGRSYLLASASLIIVDLFSGRKMLRHYKIFLIGIPIIVTILSFIIGYLTKDLYISAIDTGLAGRLFMFGYIIKRLDIFKFFFGFKDIMSAGVALDVSTFAIFTTRGIVMLVFLLVCYVKYIKTIGVRYYKYLPAIISIVIAAVTLPMLAWFSISMVIFLCLLEHTRKINNELNHRYCTGI